MSLWGLYLKEKYDNTSVYWRSFFQTTYNVQYKINWAGNVVATLFIGDQHKIISFFAESNNNIKRNLC